MEPSLINISEHMTLGWVSLIKGLDSKWMEKRENVCMWRREDKPNKRFSIRRGRVQKKRQKEHTELNPQQIWLGVTLCVLSPTKLKRKIKTSHCHQTNNNPMNRGQAVKVWVIYGSNSESKAHIKIMSTSQTLLLLVFRKGEESGSWVGGGLMKRGGLGLSGGTGYPPIDTWHCTHLKDLSFAQAPHLFFHSSVCCLIIQLFHKTHSHSSVGLCDSSKLKVTFVETLLKIIIIFCRTFI